MISKKDKKIQFSEYGEHFTRQIADADKLRDESLKRLHKIRASRHSTQQRELARLEDKFGVDDDRVIRHAVRIKREREIVDYMKVSIDKSVVEAETISDSYILKGKIRENSRAFLTGYTVQLMDNKNNVIGKPVKTDSNGDYSFIVEINDDNKEKKFNIAVLDKQGTQVHKDRVPVSLKQNIIDTRDIILTDSDKINRPTKRTPTISPKIKKAVVRPKKRVPTVTPKTKKTITTSKKKVTKTATGTTKRTTTKKPPK